MSQKILTYGFLLITLLISSSLCAQTPEELEKERAQLNQQIQTTQDLLRKTDGSKKESLSALETLQAQMRSRRQLVENYRRDLDLSKEKVKRLDDSIAYLESVLTEKTEAYFATLRKMYRWKKQQPSWMYYISAQGANELFRRWIYLNQLEAWQDTQRQTILSLKESVESSREEVEAERRRRAEQLQREEQNAKALSRDLGEEQRLLDQLKQKEQELRRQLDKQMADRRALDKAISSAIEKGRKDESEEDEPAFASTPQGKAISGAFAENKGALPWPVERGVVTRKFGKQRHASLPNIEIQNNGIDISTEKSANVRAIFDGTVVGTAEVPGYHNMVILRHGKFFTVYSRLDQVTVSQGQSVNRNEAIGRLAVDEDDGQSRLHFEIWEDKKKLNPLYWIAQSQ